MAGSRYTEDAVGYLTGILSMADLLSAVRAARDAAIRRIVADALLRDLCAGAPVASSAAGILRRALCSPSSSRQLACARVVAMAAHSRHRARVVAGPNM